MRKNDEKLQRLLDAAGRTVPAEPTVPFGLENRVLANWRAQDAQGDVLPVFAFLRRATLGAGLVLALSAAWSFTQIGEGAAADEAAQLDYNIQMSLNP